MSAVWSKAWMPALASSRTNIIMIVSSLRSGSSMMSFSMRASGCTLPENSSSFVTLPIIVTLLTWCSLR